MTEVMTLVIITLYIYLLVATFYLLLDNREPTSTIAWILVFFFLPVVGFIVYFFIGRNWRKKRRNEQIDQDLIDDRLHRKLRPFIKHHEKQMEKYDEAWRYPKYKKELMHLLYQSSASLLTTNNNIQLFFDGERKFSALLADLKKAKSYIFMEYFIWRDDSLSAKIKSILIKKAQDGVHVLVLTDSLGSLFLTKSYRRELQQAGVRIYRYYNFLSFVRFHTLNYRNHRKIVIVDGEVGYTGGMNIGNEYIDGGKRFRHWRDTHLRLQGEAVTVLKAIFAIDWFNTTHEDLFKNKYFQKFESPEHTVSPVQITTSGPDSKWPSIKQLFFCLINSAQNNIFIQTPYFIPDPSIYTALKTAGLRGLDVRLMVTGVPDKKLPYWSAFTYFEELLNAGVKIYHYKKGFFHAKAIAIDSEICSIGTANMDMRSFSLNYELNTLLYDKKLTKEIEAQFVKDLQVSKMFTLKAFEKMHYMKKLGHSISRLVAPLL